MEGSSNLVDKKKTKLIDDLLKKIAVSENNKKPTSIDEDTFLYAVWFLLPVPATYEASNHFQFSQVRVVLYTSILYKFALVYCIY